MSIKADINKLITPAVSEKTLEKIDPADSILSRVGTAKIPEQDSGSGIASPLTESDRQTVDFEVFDEFNVFSVVIKAVIEITMDDADGKQVVFNYTDPNTL